MVQAKPKASCQGELGLEFSAELSATGLEICDEGMSVFRSESTTDDMFENLDSESSDSPGIMKVL
jgi:hypothetical protein